MKAINKNLILKILILSLCFGCNDTSKDSNKTTIAQLNKAPLKERKTTPEDKINNPKIKAAYNWILSMSKPLNQPEAKNTGLVRSYEVPKDDIAYGTVFEKFTFAYDQALCLASSIILEDKANSILFADGLVKMQQKQPNKYAGGFRFSGIQTAPSDANDVYFTGAHAIATYSLLLFINKYPNISNKEKYIKSINEAFKFLEPLRIVEDGERKGMYKGGYGAYIKGIYQDNKSEWTATEHMHDLYFLFVKANEVLKEKKYNVLANEVKTALLDKLWNKNNNRFFQGYGESGPDTKDTLDTNSWLSIFLSKINEEEKVNYTLNRLSTYIEKDTASKVTGWNAYSKLGGYATSVNGLVWYEGSWGVALSLYRAGKIDRYNDVIKELEKGQLNSGAFLYSTKNDVNNDLKMAPSIASTAWYIIATEGKDLFWN